MSDTHVDVDGPAGHEANEGLALGADQEESVHNGRRCSPDTPVRTYAIAAINVEITLNRYLDYDPQGRMYVLEEDVPRVRQEEAQNRAARAGLSEPGVSVGLQGDAIQPLTIRVNQGQCLRITFRNDFADGQPASLHLHGSTAYVAGMGQPAIATNRAAVADPGQSVEYEWMVESDEPEGTHYFHSHGDTRELTSHGLFGAVLVEPAGSAYLDPRSGREASSGWDAIIVDPTGRSFREFALYYHEIGNERYRHLDRDGRLVVQVDPFTESYRPGDRALNYRSEPFMNRLALQQQLLGTFDKSAAYSSYTFGDPGTPLARSYLGDRVKQRVVHGGSEVFHVHHVHGGAIRWRRQPGVEPEETTHGLDKHPPLVPQASERVDAQAIGPSETYDVENECGSGGCQQSAGDYLIHCHIAHHYLSGMWMIWRVYDTLQDGATSQDAMPGLVELPDELGQMRTAVTSEALIGTTVDWKGQSFQITADNLSMWVERQLPPAGVTHGYDASVLDWKREGDRYLNEPETDRAWPGYRPTAPGSRTPLFFDPRSGKLAYPFLRPHLGKRPPFAPDHGPAPFLEPIHSGTEPAQPGQNGPWSLCPAGARVQSFVVHAINLPISLNSRIGLQDPSGALFVLKEQEAAVHADRARKEPLAIRANAGQDCVDVMLKSELEDTRENAFLSKVDVHIHFVQFDVQASDGVDTGFNYEQSVRPFTVEGEPFANSAEAGMDTILVRNAQRFQPGSLVGVGMEQDKTFEIARVRAADGARLTLTAPLRFDHLAGEIVSSEFVRYRWYPDAQFGTAYFHDHVDALHAWRHGLFGALVAEPPDATYHDPHSGEPVRSGAIADVHTDRVVSADIIGSFRELVSFIQDDNPRTRVGNSSGGTINLRAEPLSSRGGDPAQVFSSRTFGDPETPLLEAFLGDPVVVRALVAGANDLHTWHLDGHWFRVEPFSRGSPPTNTIHVGISERYDLSIAQAGGPQNLPGDYLYYNGRSFKLLEGNWGILRVLAAAEGSGLRSLPGHERLPAAATAVCPPDAPRKSFAVEAIEAPLPMLGRTGKLYVLADEREATLSGDRPPQPLVLHVNVGDCIVLNLTNQTAEGPVSLHADMLAFDPRSSAGVDAGHNGTRQVVMPGESQTYTYYAHPDLGETTALLRDWGNVLINPSLGLYGAVVVGPHGATYSDPKTGEDVGMKSRWRVDVNAPDGGSYRDFALLIQDQDEVIGTAQMPYSEQVQGAVGINYQAEPLAVRLHQVPDPASVYSSAVHGDPSTPLLEAFAGDRIRVHVLAPANEQAHVFSIEGHRWPFEVGRSGTPLVSSAQLGALEVLTLFLTAGPSGQAGDYLYGDHREPYRQAGVWGLLRVYSSGDLNATLLPLR